jgi:hypothetical protein
MWDVEKVKKWIKSQVPGLEFEGNEAIIPEDQETAALYAVKRANDKFGDRIACQAPSYVHCQRVKVKEFIDEKRTG